MKNQNVVKISTFIALSLGITANIWQISCGFLIRNLVKIIHNKVEKN